MTEIKMTSPIYVQGNPASGGITLFSLTPWSSASGVTVIADSSSCVSNGATVGICWNANNSRSVNIAYSASINHGTATLYYGITDAAPTQGYHIYWYCGGGTAYPYNQGTSLGSFSYGINSKFVITGDGTNWRFYLDGSLKVTLAYSSVLTPVNVPYVYVGTSGTGWNQIEYRELTGSAIVPAVAPISASAQLKVSSTVAGGGMVAPIQYSLLPWRSQSANCIATSNSITNNTGNVGEFYPYTSFSANFAMSANVNIPIGTGVSAFGFSIDQPVSNTTVIYWLMDKTNMSLQWYHPSQNATLFTAARESVTDFNITYDGTVFNCYAGGIWRTYKSESSSQKTKPFYHASQLNDTITNIWYGELTGSVSPALPPVFINFK